jgi:copper chaperone CopZ
MKKLFLFLSIMGMLVACSSTDKKAKTSGLIMDTTQLSTIVLKVGGMSCTGCEQTISKAVESLPGVNKATASYTDSVATVVFDPKLVTTEQISNKINEVGYTVLAKK